MKRLTENHITGQRGDLLVADRTLAMGSVFDGDNRRETGVDGFLELRDPQTGQTLANWFGAQVKTTVGGSYSHEDDTGFDYLLSSEDLAYWRDANIRTADRWWTNPGWNSLQR